MELTSCVTTNGRIPWNIIHEFARINKIEDIETFSHCVRVLESVFKEESDGKAN